MRVSSSRQFQNILKNENVSLANATELKGKKVPPDNRRKQ